VRISGPVPTAVEGCESVLTIAVAMALIFPSNVYDRGDSL